jgi:gas vesicle protein
VGMTKRGGGFLLGAAAGAVAALLLAPRSGKETRAQVFGAKDSFGGQAERLMGALDVGKGKAADQSEALKRKIEETRARLKRQMDAGDDPVSDATADETPSDPSTPV